MKRTALAWLVVALATSISLAAQSRTPVQPVPAGSSSSVTAGGVGDIQNLLAQLQQTTLAATRDVSSLRIEKWKTDGATKGQAQSRAESVRRNLTDALPGIISQVQRAPDDLAASFNLYRNLGALYDVMSSLAEEAGAFGPKGEFEALASDLNGIDRVRRVLGDRVAALATIKEGELVRLRNQLKTAQGAAAPASAKKVIVDDEQPKKTVKKKKKPATAPATSSTGPSTTSGTTPPR